MINGLFHRIAQNQSLLGQSNGDMVDSNGGDDAATDVTTRSFFPPNPFMLGTHQLFLTPPPPGVQLMTIPVSLAAIPGSNQIPVIATSTGQFILANVASMPSAFASQVHSSSNAPTSISDQKKSTSSRSSLDDCNTTDAADLLVSVSNLHSSSVHRASPVSVGSDESGTKNTVNQLSDANTVDGVDLEEVREFARQFKIRRLSLGLTQTQVGLALSAAEGPAYSQSAICRFEKLDITPKSASKIKPVLESWMAEAEEKFRNGSCKDTQDNSTGDNSKKRKRRTSFTPNALELLNDYFEKNTHPNSNEMTQLSESLHYDREVIRVWFCNRRQALKNTIKRLRPAQVSSNNTSTVNSEQCAMNLSLPPVTCNSHDVVEETDDTHLFNTSIFRENGPNNNDEVIVTGKSENTATILPQDLSIQHCHNSHS